MAKEPEQLSLAPAEWEIMKVLWEKGSAAARDVYVGLPADNSWAYKTVKTLLSRLVAKGAVTYEQVGNSYLYRPAVAQERRSPICSLRFAAAHMTSRFTALSTGT